MKSRAFFIVTVPPHGMKDTTGYCQSSGVIRHLATTAAHADLDLFKTVDFNEVCHQLVDLRRYREYITNCNNSNNPVLIVNHGETPDPVLDHHVRSILDRPVGAYGYQGGTHDIVSNDCPRLEILGHDLAVDILLGDYANREIGWAKDNAAPHLVPAHEHGRTGNCSLVLDSGGVAPHDLAYWYAGIEVKITG